MQKNEKYHEFITIDMNTDLRYTSCSFCHSDELKFLIADILSAEIYDNGIRCIGCGRTYTIIWGVPFLGAYKKEEILSLLEIASTTESYNINNRDKKPMEKFGIETLINTGAINTSKVIALFSKNVGHGTDIINRLRKQSIAVNCIVPEGQRAFYTWISGITIVETYDYTNFKLTNEGKINELNIIVAGDRKEVLELSGLINKHENVFVGACPSNS